MLVKICVEHQNILDWKIQLMCVFSPSLNISPTNASCFHLTRENPCEPRWNPCRWAMSHPSLAVGSNSIAQRNLPDEKNIQKYQKPKVQKMITQVYPIASMYGIYIPTFAKKSTIHVGKYTIFPWIRNGYILSSKVLWCCCSLSLESIDSRWRNTPERQGDFGGGKINGVSWFP